MQDRSVLHPSYYFEPYTEFTFERCLEGTILWLHTACFIINLYPYTNGLLLTYVFVISRNDAVSVLLLCSTLRDQTVNAKVVDSPKHSPCHRHNSCDV